MLNKVTKLKPVETASLPDIATEERAKIAGRLDRVGMDDIEMPIYLLQADGSHLQTPARISAFVNLSDPNAQGIHMSRLYLQLDELLSKKPVSPSTMQQLVDGFLESHADISDEAYLRIEFDYLTRRQALISDNTGWRRYPLSVTTSIKDGELHHELGLRIIYSSTCPCSAALARQVIQENFKATFAGQETLKPEQVFAWLGEHGSINATPHSQRSAADVRMRLSLERDEYPLIEMVDLLEEALHTPVQAAVKREDEQAFALLNGVNPMFCEDAGRQVKAALEADKRIQDYWACCQHFESLHPHDAVSVITKGVKGGYLP